MEITNDKTTPLRVHTDLSDWRAASARDELWMYVDQHWGESAPKGLTDLEWDQHFTALLKAKAATITEKSG